MTKTIKSTKTRKASEDLLDAGLGMLEHSGIDQLTIDALCTRLGVTKGSFYHHFKGRDDYLERLLEYWVGNWTMSRMESADQAGSPAERFAAIVAASNTLPHGPETSIRAWALRDPLARRYLERVDALRMDYLRGIFEEATGDPARARLLSRISYSLFVGTRMVAPPVMGQERDEIITLVARELYGMDIQPGIAEEHA